METLLGTILGILFAAIAFYAFQYFKSQKQTRKQSVILIDKVKRVCKFITVEGDFAEIYHYEDVKQKFLNMITSRKKALVVINAKAHIGFDLKKVDMEADTKNKRVVMRSFPNPEILSIDTTINYYDKRDGYFNRFAASDLSDLQSEAKKHIEDKIPQSGLYDVAKGEALEAISLIETMIETIGWTLDYSALKIDTNQKEQLDANRSDS
ncbi:MAG: DUF4230 domain-containing protein [Bacteroidia bacterium]|nr:DUF4230 domain-containing protein [Bacteroidia bacterium]MBT8287447.1 DUF4230 domain-containing protein [Bacteroidia bacterium]NNF81821.1 DUF4230 domain-containing protein [Flavobacteriaceae bacterium]NNK72630.1 DUF4230 domain-containing protein [Flavobacteriaceae bacterium]